MISGGEVRRPDTSGVFTFHEQKMQSKFEMFGNNAILSKHY